MEVVIFGGGGFIGSAIADRLLRSGHSLRIFERPRVVPYRRFGPEEDVRWISGDLLSLHDVSRAIAGAELIIHLVSTTLPKSSNDDPIYDVQSNLVGSLHLLNAMVANGVRKILFISSGGTVYGKALTTPMDENHPTNPIVPYGATKRSRSIFWYTSTCMGLFRLSCGSPMHMASDNEPRRRRVRWGYSSPRSCVGSHSRFGATEASSETISMSAMSRMRSCARCPIRDPSVCSTSALGSARALMK